VAEKKKKRLRGTLSDVVVVCGEWHASEILCSVLIYKYLNIDFLTSYLILSSPFTPQLIDVLSAGGADGGSIVEDLRRRRLEVALRRRGKGGGKGGGEGGGKGGGKGGGEGAANL
jgi:hypothetical protein